MDDIFKSNVHDVPTGPGSGIISLNAHPNIVISPFEVSSLEFPEHFTLEIQFAPLAPGSNTACFMKPYPLHLDILPSIQLIRGGKWNTNEFVTGKYTIKYF